MLIINRNDIEDFTEFSHDRNPLHIDRDYASKTPFGDCVVYGILGILKILDRILADDNQQDIFIESIQYKFHSPLRENKAYQLIKREQGTGNREQKAEGRGQEAGGLEKSEVGNREQGVGAQALRPDNREEDWQLWDGDRVLVELKLSHFPCSLGKIEIAENSIAYPDRAANPNHIDLVNSAYQEEYALDRTTWTNFLNRHPNLEKIPLEQLTCLIWTSYCIGMRSPGRQALYMSGKIDFSKDILDRDSSCSLLKCSVSPQNWDAATGNLVLAAEVKAQDRVIAKVNLASLKRPNSVAIDLKTIASNLNKVPTNHWLRGKICLVIGGSRGLGSTIAKSLTFFGAIVAINYRSSDDEAKTVLADIQNNGGEALLCKGDISQPGICQQIVDKIVKQYGGLDLVVNNAYPAIDCIDFLDLDFDRFQRAVMTPLQMSYEVARSTIKQLQKRQGIIITISSIYAQTPEPGFSGYSSAKNAVEGLTRSLAVEFPEVRQVIYRPSKFLSDRTITNFSQTHLQDSLEVVKNLWIGLDRLRAQNINPFILDESLVDEITKSLSQDLIASPLTDSYKAKIALAATFTAEPIADFLNFWIQELKLPLQIEFAPYNQVFQELLDPSSLLSLNQDGINLVLIRFEDWKREETDADLDNLQNKIKRNVNDLVTALKSAAAKSKTPLLVYLCANSPITDTQVEWTSFFEEMSAYVQVELAGIEGMYLTTDSELAALYPVDNYYDEQGDKRGHIPFTAEYFTALATAIARKIYTLKSAPHKVIVLDCDNTLWKGVCGEDGAMGIKIDPPYEALQKFMVAQSERGMLLCLCSKNVEEDAIEVFKRRPEMPLKLEKLVAWRINWLPKSENIKSLAEELNLGLDSFIFIDDNPVECSEVKANCPEVLTLQLPQDTETIPLFLQHVWAFDRLKLTETDKQRTELYKQNVERERLRTQTLDFEQFLAELELNIAISPMQSEQLARVSQLTERTNQFNATTIRRSEAEIQHLCQTENYQCLVVEVSDRFGDYGLVGVILCQKDIEVLKVDTFLLSCRVLGRGVEHRMLARLGEIAAESGLNRVEMSYIPSPKNQPVLNFLEGINSNFKQRSFKGFCFSFPVDYAASITFTPQASQTDLPVEEKSDRTTPNFSSIVSDIGKSTRLDRIARELYKVETILPAIEAKLLAVQNRKHLQPQNSNKLTKFIAARTDTEKKLAEIWAKVLRLQQISIDDNYFDLGGTSVLAVSIFTQIETVFGVNLPITTLIEAATIEKLAQILERDVNSTPWSSLVPIRPTGNKTPLFFVHGGFGDVLGLTTLAKYLDRDRPFYGLRGIGLDGIQNPLTSVGEMAKCYLAEIRNLQPQGPYLLGGQCWGGTVAFEMAQQLKAEGQEVALLALLDTPYPPFENYFATRYRFYSGGEPRFRYDNKDYGIYVFGLLYHRKRPWRYFQKFLSNSQARSNLNQQPNERQIYIKHCFFETFLRALQAYTPQPYQGKIDYFLPLLHSYAAIAYPNQLQSFLPHSKPVKAFPRLLFGWDEIAAAGMKIHEFESTHIGMIQEPTVQALAEKLNNCLSNLAAMPSQKATSF
jgi:FkbH-like protein